MIVVTEIMLASRFHFYKIDKIFALFPMPDAGNIVNFMLRKIRQLEYEDQTW